MTAKAFSWIYDDSVILRKIYWQQKHDFDLELQPFAG